MDAINREPLEIIASVVARDEPYEGIFTTPRGVANGPLAFMNRYQAEQVGELDFSPSAPPDALPDVPLEDDTWHEYPRHPWHAGVLTFLHRRCGFCGFLRAALVTGHDASHTAASDRSQHVRHFATHELGDLKRGATVLVVDGLVPVRNAVRPR